MSILFVFCNCLWTYFMLSYQRVGGEGQWISLPGLGSLQQGAKRNVLGIPPIGKSEWKTLKSLVSAWYLACYRWLFEGDQHYRPYGISHDRTMYWTDAETIVQSMSVLVGLNPPARPQAMCSVQLGERALHRNLTDIIEQIDIATPQTSECQTLRHNNYKRFSASGERQ